VAQGVGPDQYCKKRERKEERKKKYMSIKISGSGRLNQNIILL
jgi:hypothetical protein